MNRTFRFLVCTSFLSVAVLLGGCGGSAKPPVAAAPPPPLTLEEWKAIKDIDQKYDGSTLERLRLSDARLKDDRQWYAYEQRYILPERQRDLPIPGQQPP
jgi:hypothetical protein